MTIAYFITFTFFTALLCFLLHKVAKSLTIGKLPEEDDISRVYRPDKQDKEFLKLANKHQDIFKTLYRKHYD